MSWGHRLRLSGPWPYDVDASRAMRMEARSSEALTGCGVQGGSVRKRSRSPVRLRNHQLGHVFLASTSEAATQVTAFSCYRQCFIEDYMRPVCFGADGDADCEYVDAPLPVRRHVEPRVERSVQVDTEDHAQGDAPHLISPLRLTSGDPHAEMLFLVPAEVDAIQLSPCSPLESLAHQCLQTRAVSSNQAC